ncbi:MAG: leucine-rich repeat protein [Ruminococcus flavefaciens]|nr:leucine-rich repeat protein [Ruminococcus flavefaciens]
MKIKKTISAVMAVSMCSAFALGNSADMGLNFPAVLAVSETDETDWKNAYADFLKNGDYANYISVSETPKFTTAYIDGDDIPELAVATGEEDDEKPVFIATYKNGNVTPIKATEVGAVDTYDTSKGCYGAYGKLKYAEKGSMLDPDFYTMQYAYRTFYNVNSDATTNVDSILYRYDTDYVNEKPVWEYAIDGNKVTESEYNEKLASYESRATSVIDYNVNMLEITDENIKSQLGISDDTENDEKELSGKCGDNAYWSFDESTGTLTISGTGSTYDYDKYSTPSGLPLRPSGIINQSIEHIIIEEGITRIGDSFFVFGAWKDIKFPESLEEIGDYAFESSETKEITIPKTVKKIGRYAFGTENDMDSTGLTGKARVIDGATVYGYAGSAAEKYVNDTNNDEYVVGEMKFVALDTDNTSDEYGDWRDSCKKVLEEFYNSNNYFATSMWDLYDINGDGIPELIISYGKSHVDCCEIYAYNGSDFTMLSANFYGSEINKFGKYGEIYAINGKNQFEAYDISEGREEISFFTMNGNKLTTDVAFSNNVGEVGEDKAYFYVNKKKVSLEDYNKAYAPYKNYNVTGDSVTPLGRKYKFEDYISVLDKYNNSIVSGKLSESELKSKSEKYGNVSAWQYHDYDNNGTSEAFALITEETQIKYLLFIDSDGNVTEMPKPKNKGDFLNYVNGTEQYTIADDKQGFFSADMTGSASAFTLLYSVKNNVPYELDISGNINGLFKKSEKGVFSAFIHDDGRVGSGNTYELIYNSTNKQFEIGKRINDSVSENITSGKCGDNAYWTLDKSTGTLTISGTGDIYDYGDWAYDGQTPPWCSDKDYGSDIKNIVIEEGITGIGEMCFMGSAVSDVKLPESLEKIEILAFHDCANLKEITIPKGVKEIGDRAFGQYGNSGLGVVDGFIVYGYKDSAVQEYVNYVNSIENASGKIKFVSLVAENNNTENGNNSALDSNSSSSDLGKPSPKTGDNISKIFAALLTFTGVMVISKKRNKNK